MNASWGYRLMRGRAGAAGHIRRMEGRLILSAQKLQPGEAYDVYTLGRDGARRLGALRPEPDGTGQAAFPTADRVFLARGDRVILWEDGSNADETYWASCRSLQKKEEAPDIEHPQTEPAPAPEEARTPTAEERPREQETGEKNIPAVEAAYTLRPAAGSPPVDALPALQWPAGTEQLQVYFSTRPPCSPFRAPGWRFVRVSVQLPGVAYAAVGRHVRDGRVNRVLFAVPGGPYRPPAFLPGYHYHPGREGNGYWIHEAQV